MNNGVHFLITQPFPKQAEFTNGIFLSVVNIGLSLGTIICGYVDDMIDLKMIALRTCVLLLLLALKFFTKHFMQIINYTFTNLLNLRKNKRK